MCHMVYLDKLEYYSSIVNEIQLVYKVESLMRLMKTCAKLGFCIPASFGIIRQIHSRNDAVIFQYQVPLMPGNSKDTFQKYIVGEINNISVSNP